jgi:hypothetical protein
MRLNYGGNAIRAVSAVNGQAVLSTCVIADNNETGELIRAENYFSEIYNCTIANNTIGGASVIYATVPAGNPGYDLRDSIVDQPGVVTRNAGSTFNGENILSTDGTFATTVGSPTFVNAAGGDYHLQLSSLGIDYAQTGATPSTVDLDGLSRIFDIPTIANYEGPIDLGAYERHPPCYRPDTLQCDGYDGVY